MIKVFVTVKSVYGRTMFYPACPITEIIASVAKTKTLSDSDLSAIRRLGYEILVNQPEVKL
jgi:hypothetical protein